MPDFEVLHDGTGAREKPWRVHRIGAEILSGAYLGINKSKSARLQACADYLSFVRDEDTGKLRLRRAAFCRVRLCPICQWRRSLKLYGQTSAIVEYLNDQANKQQAAAGQKQQGYSWLMLTLTQRNVTGDKLPAELSGISRAWQRLTQRKVWRDNILGSMRTVEITHNAATDTYHPHIHAILCVKPSYFKRGYINHAEWAALWKSASGLDYTPIVDIRKCYGTPEKAVAEVSKYAAKPSEYLDPSDVERMQRVVETIDAATAKRRFVAWGGLLAQAHKALALDDAEDGDLIHVDDSENSSDNADALLNFKWYPGPMLYLRKKRAVS